MVLDKNQVIVLKIHGTTPKMKFLCYARDLGYANI